MEVAVIDWKTIDSRFVKDDVYEHINAPQWVDFSSPDDYVSVDDETWFCRPECNHPKTVEDFLNRSVQTPPAKLKKSASVSEVLPFGDRTRRDATLKKRGGLNQQPSVLLQKEMKWKRNGVGDDSENQDPNFTTPPNYKSTSKTIKEAIKSSAEKRAMDDSSLRKEQTPKLKSTLSARNLFAGGDFFNKVTEFCNELKKLASRTKEKENVEKNSVQASEEEPKKSLEDDDSGLNDKEKERKPLLEVSRDNNEGPGKSKSKQKLRRKEYDDHENTPISVDVKSIRSKEGEGFSHIRTCPPTPQCFSANRGPTKATPPRALKPKLQERGILRELGQGYRDDKNEPLSKTTQGVHGPVVAERDSRTLDVFWFLKPCALSS